MAMNKTLIWILMMVCLVNVVFAIGVSPAQKTLNFKPNMEYEGSIKLLNVGSLDSEVDIHVSGELAPYIEIQQRGIVTSEESIIEVPYLLKMPSGFEAPGEHSGEIVLEEFVDTGTASGTAIKARTRISSRIIVLVPYPGKYAEARVIVKPSREKITFDIPVYNFGKETIDEAYGVIEIRDYRDNDIGEAETGILSIGPGKEEKLYAEYTDEALPGPYTAVLELNYDGELFETKEEFDFGRKNIKVLEIEAKRFRLGEIVQLEAELESGWNDILEDVSAEMVIKDENKVYTEFRTSSVDIQAMDKEKVTLFWDTKGIAVGEYELELTVEHEGSEFKKRYKLVVGEKNLEVIDLEKEPLDEKPMNLRNILLVSAGIVLLIVLAIALILGFKGKKPSNHERIENFKYNEPQELDYIQKSVKEDPRWKTYQNQS